MASKATLALKSAGYFLRCILLSFPSILGCLASIPYSLADCPVFGGNYSLVNIVIDLHESSSCDYPQCGCAKELIVEHVAHRDKQHYRDDYGGTYGFSPHSQNGVVTSDVVEQYATIENGTQDS
jgi:hypothetical protein